MAAEELEAVAADEDLAELIHLEEIPQLPVVPEAAPRESVHNKLDRHSLRVSYLIERVTSL